MGTDPTWSIIDSLLTWAFNLQLDPIETGEDV